MDLDWLLVEYHGCVGMAGLLKSCNATLRKSIKRWHWCYNNISETSLALFCVVLTWMKASDSARGPELVSSSQICHNRLFKTTCAVFLKTQKQCVCLWFHLFPSHLPLPASWWSKCRQLRDDVKEKSRKTCARCFWFDLNKDQREEFYLLPK